MAARGNLQAKVPMLSGNPSAQAMSGALTSKGIRGTQPARSPGKPARSLVGKPASTPVNKGTKQPKGGKQTVKKGTVPGIRKGKIAATDMGIG
jgi:hypothetical protein